MGINLTNQKFYAKAVAKNNGKSAPDARLPPMVVGGILFTAGLFMFGWTAAPKYHWALPVVAAGMIGAGFNTIFQQCINVLVDTYGLYAASATAANTFLRSLFAFGLPLAAGPMFRNLVSIYKLSARSINDADQCTGSGTSCVRAWWNLLSGDPCAVGLFPRLKYHCLTLTFSRFILKAVGGRLRRNSKFAPAT